MAVPTHDDALNDVVQAGLRSRGVPVTHIRRLGAKVCVADGAEIVAHRTCKTVFDVRTVVTGDQGQKRRGHLVSAWAERPASGSPGHFDAAVAGRENDLVAHPATPGMSHRTQGRPSRFHRRYRLSNGNRRRAIGRQGGTDYLLALEGNQPAHGPCQDVALFVRRARIQDAIFKDDIEAACFQIKSTDNVSWPILEWPPLIT